MHPYAVWILLSCVSGWAQSFDYCKITCQGQEHTMCKYKEDPGPLCLGYKNDPLTKEEMNELVDKHNELRRKVALGKETSGSLGPQSSASNMHELVWDDELAKIAQRWADQCTLGHDRCRNVERFKVGQNYAATSTSAVTFIKDVGNLVDGWYREVNDVVPDIVEKFSGSSVVGHYTQLVWAKTKYVGCGRVFYGDVSRSTALLCNYGPAGNFLGEEVYKIGKPCSACEEGETCNDGLCSWNGGGVGSCNPQPEFFLCLLVAGILIFVTHYINLD